MILKQTLLADYRQRLADLRRELARRPKNSDEATRVRELIDHYERQIGELEQPNDTGNQIGAPPTLGGDGKSVLDC
jgi:hypothetical protein